MISGQPLMAATPSGSGQLIKQRIGVLQNRRVEALGEPAVDWRKKVAALSVMALVPTEPGKAHRSAQLPESGILLLGDPQGFAILFLSRLDTPPSQQHFTFEPV